MPRLTRIAAALFLVLTAPALADPTAGGSSMAPKGDSPHFLSGYGLWGTCTADPSTPAGSGCVPYIEGVYDTHVAENDAFGSPRLVCPPKDVDAQQFRGAVQRFLDKFDPKNPQLAKPAAVLVLVALRQEWPCDK